MVLLGTKVAEFDEAFIQMLIDNKVPESSTLDYKLRHDISGDINRLELLRDISAFHNTEGGVLIIGLNEVKIDKAKKGYPELPSTNQLTFSDYEQTKSQIATAVLTGTSPRIVGLSFSRLIDIKGRKVFAIGIPANTSIPSMVTYNSTNGIYKRNNTDKYMPDSMELYRTFLRQNQVQSEIKQFLEAREFAFPTDHIIELSSSPLAFVRIIPQSFQDHISLPHLSGETFLEDCKRFFPTQPGGQKVNQGYTLDGLMVIQSDGDMFGREFKQQGYDLFLRDGCIERANGTMFTVFREGELSILYVDQLAQFIKSTVAGAFDYYNLVELNPQFFLSITLNNLLPATDFVNGSPIVGKFKRVRLSLPTLFCVDRESTSRNLALLFDIIWQSGGKRECPEDFKRLYCSL